MKSSILNKVIFSKERAEQLSKIRIIKKNLVHIHGLPKNMAKKEILKSNEYLGQYGKIINVIIVHKLNSEGNKKVYSAYITYTNEIEAAYAVLCVDSLLIEGKIIRAFYGTTKYCRYFLENRKCPNEAKCLFLHHLIDDQDIILDENTTFTYNDHINLSKKIINFSNPIQKELIMKMKKPKKNIFPFMDFIFLNEKEKEKYFDSGNINYFSSSNNCQNNSLNNNVLKNCKEKKTLINNNIINFNINNAIFINKSPNEQNFNNINNIKGEKILSTSNDVIFYDKNSLDDMEPPEMQKLLTKSINHILLSKAFFSNIKNIPLRKMELEYLKQDLNKNGISIEELFKGCLDNISDIL